MIPRIVYQVADLLKLATMTFVDVRRFEIDTMLDLYKTINRAEKLVCQEFLFEELLKFPAAKRRNALFSFPSVFFDCLDEFPRTLNYAALFDRSKEVFDEALNNPTRCMHLEEILCAQGHVEAILSLPERVRETCCHPSNLEALLTSVEDEHLLGQLLADNQGEFHRSKSAVMCIRANKPVTLDILLNSSKCDGLELRYHALERIPEKIHAVLELHFGKYEESIDNIARRIQTTRSKGIYYPALLDAIQTLLKASPEKSEELLECIHTNYKIRELKLLADLEPSFTKLPKPVSVYVTRWQQEVRSVSHDQQAVHEANQRLLPFIRAYRQHIQDFERDFIASAFSGFTETNRCNALLAAPPLNDLFLPDEDEVYMCLRRATAALTTDPFKIEDCLLAEFPLTAEYLHLASEKPLAGLKNFTYSSEEEKKHVLLEIEYLSILGDFSDQQTANLLHLFSLNTAIPEKTELVKKLVELCFPATDSMRVIQSESLAKAVLVGVFPTADSVLEALHHEDSQLTKTRTRI